MRDGPRGHSYSKYLQKKGLDHDLLLQQNNRCCKEKSSNAKVECVIPTLRFSVINVYVKSSEFAFEVISAERGFIPFQKKLEVDSKAK